MIDSVLERKQFGMGIRLTVKTVIALAVVGLAVALPQLAHLAIGQGAGIKFLPMYLPVLIGGCMLGWRFGACKLSSDVGCRNRNACRIETSVYDA